MNERAVIGERETFRQHETQRKTMENNTSIRIELGFVFYPTDDGSVPWSNKIIA